MGAIVAIVGSATTVTTTYINRSAVHEETKPAVEQTAAVHEKQKEFEQQLGETKRLDKEAHERIEQHLNHLDDQQGKLLEAVLKGRR
jgi:DNA-directed RNA polymerase specialized sigma24 family protein